MGITNSGARFFPVTHSTLSAAALMSEVLPDYNVGAPIACKLLGMGLNDTYQVDTAEQRYILEYIEPSGDRFRILATSWRC
jgi:hypothetical protein